MGPQNRGAGGGREEQASEEREKMTGSRKSDGASAFPWVEHVSFVPGPTQGQYTCIKKINM